MSWESPPEPLNRIDPAVAPVTPEPIETVADCPIQLPPMEKHPAERLKPTLDVDVAEPETVNPDKVVVPKPIDETESCVAVLEPTTNPKESPAIGLTLNLANGVVEETPSNPVAVNVVVAVPPNSAKLADNPVDEA